MIDATKLNALATESENAANKIITDVAAIIEFMTAGTNSVIPANTIGNLEYIRKAACDVLHQCDILEAVDEDARKLRAESKESEIEMIIRLVKEIHGIDLYAEEKKYKEAQAAKKEHSGVISFRDIKLIDGFVFSRIYSDNFPLAEVSYCASNVESSEAYINLYNQCNNAKYCDSALIRVIECAGLTFQWLAPCQQ